jgi:hypothetical protein
MDRRRFLAGLFASGVVASAAPILIEEVSRVYSFPTNIVFPTFDYTYYQWAFHEHPRFRENLMRKSTAFAKWSQNLPIPRASGKDIKMFMYTPVGV